MGGCPRSGGLIVTVDIDLGDVQPAVSQNGGGGLEVGGGLQIGDTILDRLIHNAYTITLKGESMRKKKARNLTPDEPSGMNT